MATELVVLTQGDGPDSVVPQPSAYAVTDPVAAFQEWLRGVDVESLTDRGRVERVAWL